MLNAADVKKAVSEALDEKMQEYWVDRQEHYRHHQFIESLILWSDRVSSTIVRTVVKSIVIGLTALLLIGFAVWGRMPK